METSSGNVWLLLLTSPICHFPQASPAEMIVGHPYSMKPSWQKLHDFSLRLKGICLSRGSSAVATTLLWSTAKPPAQLPSLQKREGPFWFFFFIIFCV